MPLVRAGPTISCIALISVSERMPPSLSPTLACCNNGGSSPSYPVNHHERLLASISKWVLVWLALVVVVLSAETESIGNNIAGDFHVAPETGRIQDSFGRERIFHGLNVVSKGAPWHPRVDSFHPQFSFAPEDIALLKEWGMNVVRLGVMWPGVEPTREHFNSTYLAVMQSIVGSLHTAGISTVLEFHQDVFSSQFCGEGLPPWILVDYVKNPVETLQKQNSSSSFQETPANEPLRFDIDNKKVYRKTLSYSPRGDELSDTHKQLSRRHVSKRKLHSRLESRLRYPASFPEPLGRRWPWPSEWERDGWEPSVESCNKHTWWSYYLSYAVSRAFQDLYDNKWGWGDLMAGYWTVVAGAFKDQPGVLGYELMNEPWPGDVFSNPFLFLPGVADAKNLARFYEKLQAAVRSVDRERILFYETITFDNFRCGWSTVPGGVKWQNKTVLSYHYYTPPNFTAKQAFAERARETRKLGCGSMLTEFFVSDAPDNRNWEDFWMIRNQLDGTLKEVESVLEDEQRLFSDVKEKNLEQKIEETDSVDGVLLAADAHVQSWIGWEYKAFFTKTGSVVKQTLFGDDGELNLVLAKKLARTYPQCVCGTIDSYVFDPTTSEFSFSYVAGRHCRDREKVAHTEIFVHRGFYYPQGLLVEVNQMCASVTQSDRIIQIEHTVDCVGLLLDVRISRPDPII